MGSFPQNQQPELPSKVRQSFPAPLMTEQLNEAYQTFDPVKSAKNLPILTKQSIPSNQQEWSNIVMSKQAQKVRNHHYKHQKNTDSQNQYKRDLDQLVQRNKQRKNSEMQIKQQQAEGINLAVSRDLAQSRNQKEIKNNQKQLMNKYYQVAFQDLKRQKIQDRYAQLKEAKIYTEPLISVTDVDKNEENGLYHITDRQNIGQTRIQQQQQINNKRKLQKFANQEQIRDKIFPQEVQALNKVQQDDGQFQNRPKILTNNFNAKNNQMKLKDILDKNVRIMHMLKNLQQKKHYENSQRTIQSMRKKLQYSYKDLLDDQIKKKHKLDSVSGALNIPYQIKNVKKSYSPTFRTQSPETKYPTQRSISPHMIPTNTTNTDGRSTKNIPTPVQQHFQ